MPSKEFEFIERIRSLVAASPGVPVGIGDDAAVLHQGEGQVLVTVDMLLEGVHFDLATTGAFAVGRKAMNVNLSDIAAMAGNPTAAVVAVGLPAGRSASLADDLFAGIQSAADAFDVALVGGDTNRSPAGLVLCITVLGETTGNGPVLRSGGKPGDVLCVTGPLGYSLDGKHLSFTPRVREAHLLHDRYHLDAMLDLSDGLASDLFHITDESKCGAVIESDQVPIRSASILDGRSPLDHALNDGEDFELLFALPPDDAARLLAEQPLETPVARIGTLTSDQTVWLRDAAGLKPFPRGGFVHKW